MEGIDKNTCLHCGTSEPGYCEECYQELISDNTKLQAKIISCLEFIDDLLPKYLKEKSHIISGDDWELNRSIYVMDELRDRLMGYIRKGE